MDKFFYGFEVGIGAFGLFLIIYSMVRDYRQSKRAKQLDGEFRELMDQSSKYED